MLLARFDNEGKFEFREEDRTDLLDTIDHGGLNGQESFLDMMQKQKKAELEERLADQRRLAMAAAGRDRPVSAKRPGSARPTTATGAPAENEGAAAGGIGGEEFGV